MNNVWSFLKPIVIIIGVFALFVILLPFVAISAFLSGFSNQPSRRDSVLITLALYGWAVWLGTKIAKK
jgi:hypothetical protein